MEFSAVNTIWVLVGAALVFFMQAGFAMVETGFTRAKNAGNIIMKNLMDFCIGTPVFWLVGFGLMFGAFIFLQAIGGLDIIPNEVLDFAFFNLVLCHMPCAVVSHALLALQPVVFNDGMSGRIEQRNLFGHVLLTAVVDLDGDGHILFGDNRLRLTER